MKYTAEQIESIEKKLKDMPKIDKKEKEHSKSEVIKLLSKEINILQKKGYTLEQITDALNEQGFDIKTPTLKSYLQRAKKKSVKQKKDTPAAASFTSVKASEKATFTPTPDSDEI